MSETEVQLKERLKSLTEAQGRLVCALGRGFTVPEYAKRLGVSAAGQYEQLGFIADKLGIPQPRRGQPSTFRVRWIQEHVRPLDESGFKWPGWFQEVDIQDEQAPTVTVEETVSVPRSLVRVEPQVVEGEYFEYPALPPPTPGYRPTILSSDWFAWLEQEHFGWYVGLGVGLVVAVTIIAGTVVRLLQ